MINGIAGKPGGGKSYEAVKSHVIPALKEGRRVVTNLPLNIEHFAAVYGEVVRDLIVIVEYNYHDYGNAKPFQKIEDWLEHQNWKNVKGQGVLFVIDEAHLSLPSRMRKGSGVDISNVLEFLSMHRHYGFDVLLITQNFKKVHADIRDMVQLVYRCIKKSMFGQDDKYIIKVHEGCTTQVVNTDEREYESYVFKFYKSHTKSEGQIVEATTRDVTPWHKTGLMKLSYVVMFLASLMVINLIHKITKDDEPIVSEVKKSEPVVSKPKPITTKSTVTKSTSVNQALPTVSVPADVVVSSVPAFVVDEEELEHNRIVALSKERHPFSKVGLSISGYAEDLNYKIFYFSAQQNGQHVFTITTKDLLLAGYDIQVLSDCMVVIEFHKYKEYLTCNRQSIGVKSPVDTQIVSNN